MKRTYIALLLIAVMILSACSQTEASTQAISTTGSTDSEVPTQSTLDLTKIHTVPHETFEIPEPDPEDDVIHYGVNRFKVEKLEPISSHILEIENAEDNGYVVLEFSGAEKDHIYSDSFEYQISSGSSATLSISVATWMPELKKIEMGIINRDTGESWYLVRPFGNMIDYSCTFQDLTAGRYSVYLWILEAETIKSGYMRYNFT